MKNLKDKNIKQKKEESPKIQNIKFNILAIVAIIIFSISMCPVTLQNDTYYTIKIGEHILETGKVDMQDPFSWHENLPYTYPHWAYDVMIYLIFNIGGLTGIFFSTIIFACILGVLIYFTNCKISKNKPVSFLITIGAMYLLKDFIAARAQLVTFILLELTILFIENFLEKKQKRYAIGIILISVAIANLHCAVWPFFFVLFLPYIAEYIIFTMIDSNVTYKIKLAFYNRKIEKYKKLLEKQSKNKKNINYEEKIQKNKEKKEEENKYNTKLIEYIEKKRKEPYKIIYNKNKATKWLILIMIICAFTGLLTPLGDTPYTYLYKTMIGNTTQSISEHLPLTLINNKEMLCILAATIALMVFTDTKMRLKDLFMLAGLTLLMFMTRRQESMLVLFGSAIIAKMLTDLFKKYDQKGLENLEKGMVSTIGIVIVILLTALVALYFVRPKVKYKFVDANTYPVDAAEWIKENLDLDNIRLYNEYNYGSYLLYQGIPVFIDSRADLYAPEFNGTRNEDGTYSGRDIFSDYLNISNISTYYENKFEEYDITHVLIRKNSKLNMFLSRDDNYVELYSDNNFVLYERE